MLTSASRWPACTASRPAPGSYFNSGCRSNSPAGSCCGPTAGAARRALPRSPARQLADRVVLRLAGARGAELEREQLLHSAQGPAEHGQLLMTRDGKPMTKQILRDHFAKAKEAAAAKHPELAEQIKQFWFYDLRAKAADDTSDERGDQAASDLLGHDSVRTTRRHYLRRGKIVTPVK